MLKEEIDINIHLLEEIRDDEENLPAVRMQAIQTMMKSFELDEGIMQDCIKTLKTLRDDEETGAAVKVQIINTLHKLLVMVEGEPKDESKPTVDSIMQQIRGKKK